VQNVCVVILSVCGKYWRALTALAEFFFWLRYILDLFSSTGSVCTTARALGHEVARARARGRVAECDVHEWDYTAYDPGHFDSSTSCARRHRARCGATHAG
jgi:hypothetical protein